MKTYHFKKIILFSILLGSSQVSWAACTQTLSPGANVATAISGAAAGSTICLNSGSYGGVSLSNIVKTSDVIVQSVSGQGASVSSLSISNGSNHLKFQNLTIAGMDISDSTTKNITVAGSKFTGQASIGTSGMVNANILIDNNTFDGISVCANCAEGRLQVSSYPMGSQPVGVTITNNHFGGGGESDGIQVGTYGVVIGPGNVFEGIQQGNYGRHVDALQLYGQSHTTITGNIFTNDSTFIMAPDGGDTEVITNNVFWASSGGANSVQLGSHKNGTFKHNTVRGTAVDIDAKTGSPASTNASVQDNIMINANFSLNCTSCTIMHNLFDSSGSANGTNNLIGTPTFIGGTSPTTPAGYQLTSSSLGYGAASDGTNVGINSIGTGGTTTTPPSVAILSAPTNLRVN
ncbi:hypothetical protein [Methylobacter tundripaludum]|uniref:Parallel beta helix pectate lyase-like protein n=1 Tax=Methylobacter tundripaludum (strain ATCC BAA-1195 / DSM 17260 / SV96) TaxID=697282 RepID=G3J0N6_METTV|nr:hypothetical protein [Methylobacter tundripaludum]EGW20758.1 hypothetical protein Mettu_3907 [Methylobacter tundripaludum SV96]